MTSYHEATQHYTLRSNNAHNELQRWLNLPNKQPVINTLQNHNSEIFENLQPKDIQHVVQHTENALGPSSRRIGETVTPIRDWNPNYAFNHVLHHVTAQLQHLPTWQEFRNYASQDPHTRTMLWEPAQQISQHAHTAGWTTTHIKNAMQWRIGNAYYSFIREAYIVAQLNNAGLTPKYHPLVDSLFKVDLWVNNTNINLYIGNHIYRHNQTGRKTTSTQLLNDATPPYKNIDIQLPTQHTYGNVHLPKQDAINTLLNQL